MVASPPAARSQASRSVLWGVVLDQALKRKTIIGNSGIQGSGAVASTPAMVSLVCVTCARFGASRKVGVLRAWVGARGEAGVMRVWEITGGNVGVPCLLFPVWPAWRAYVGSRLSEAACLVLFCGSCCSLSACTFKRVTYDARALMLSWIWLS